MRTDYGSRTERDAGCWDLAHAEPPDTSAPEFLDVDPTDDPVAAFWAAERRTRAFRAELRAAVEADAANTAAVVRKWAERDEERERS